MVAFDAQQLKRRLEFLVSALRRFARVCCLVAVAVVRNVERSTHVEDRNVRGGVAIRQAIDLEET